MSNTTFISFARVRFTKSERSGKYTGSVPPPPDKNLGKGTGMVVVGNEVIDSQGVYDVKCREMMSGKGYIVVEAKKVYDTMRVWAEEERVVMLVNDREVFLKTDDGMWLPLAFYCNRYYDPERIARYVRRKAKFYSFAPDFDLEETCARFVEKCLEVYGKWEKDRVKKMKKEVQVGKQTTKINY